MPFSPETLAALRANEESVARMAKMGLMPGNSVMPLVPGFGGGGIPGAGGPIGIPGGSTLPTTPGPGLGGLGTAGCNLIPVGPLRDLCQAGVQTLFPPSTGTGTGITAGPECAKGQVRVGNICVSPGDVFPGGSPFITRAGGVPVAGSFGMPGFQPTLVQQPIRRCPAGFALAKDGICYVRSMIPRKFRAHPPGKRPPLSGADAAALRRIGSLQTRVKRLAKTAGLSMTTRRAPTKRTRRK